MSVLDENTLSGNYKDQYGQGPINVYDEQIQLQKMIPFNPSAMDATGQYFVELVQVTQDFGITKGGTTATSYTLLSAIAMQTQAARIKGNQTTNRTQIAIGALTRAKTDRQAFLTATKMPVLALNRSAKMVLELALLHGQYGLARITSSANASATSTVLTVTSGHWSAGIWAGVEGMPLQAFIGNGASPTLVSGGGASEVTISAVSRANKTLTVTGIAALITALDAAVLANPDAVNMYLRVAGDVTNEMVGMHKICGHTTGTLFNIDSDTWSVWQANTYDSAGIFNFDKLENATSLMAERGVTGKLRLYCHSKTWSSLAKQNNALRVLDSSYSKSSVDYGSGEITYHTSIGTIAISTHMYCKEGFAYLFKEDMFKRIGSCDIIFNDPLNDQKFFFTLQESNGVEMRAFTDQSLFTNELRACTLISGITY